MSDLEKTLQEKEDAIYKLEEDLRESRKKNGKENEVYPIHEMDASSRVFCIVVIKHGH